MIKGKDKCAFLRLVRADIADKYGLDYAPAECKHKGDCSGTCPKCDAELKFIQEQLDERGIKDVDFMHELVEGVDNSDDSILEGDICTPENNGDKMDTITMGMPMPPFSFKEKKRVLYKECNIAGITFHDLDDVWDELYVGAELVLIRHKENKYDRHAIAVALADDYDGNPDDFDFDYILGYVPRTENEHMAMLMDLGWSNIFECKLSQINGTNPYKGSLTMKIYLVSKDEETLGYTDNLIRALKLDEEKYLKFTSDLYKKGCTYFRFGGFPPWEHKFPKKGEKVVFLYKEKETTTLYLMHCIAVGDDDAAFFVEDKESLHAVDDYCYYVFTNSKGPITVENKELDFLNRECINTYEPEEFLSEYATDRIKEIFKV